MNVRIRHALCPLNSPLDANRACFCTTPSCASALKPDAPDSLVDLAMFPTDSHNDHLLAAEHLKAHKLAPNHADVRNRLAQTVTLCGDEGSDSGSDGMEQIQEAV